MSGGSTPPSPSNPIKKSVRQPTDWRIGNGSGQQVAGRNPWNVGNVARLNEYLANTGFLYAPKADRSHQVTSERGAKRRNKGTIKTYAVAYSQKMAQPQSLHAWRRKASWLNIYISWIALDRPLCVSPVWTNGRSLGIYYWEKRFNSAAGTMLV